MSFAPQEISFPSRFKWLKDTYITYDDPTLFSGTRASFKNKCLYDKECLLADSLDYLFIKIGIKYFLTEAHAEFLKSKRIEHEKVFYRINNNYNFGHSDLSYRNGLLIWYNLLLVLILGACVLQVVNYRRIK